LFAIAGLPALRVMAIYIYATLAALAGVQSSICVDVEKQFV
jgi:hypothetical protein